jgi:tetratricopeptide (TPR) repeat protein
MSADELDRLLADLEAGRINERVARKLAAKVPADPAAGRQASALVGAATDAYSAGRARQAWAAATLADGVTKAWSEHPLHVLRGHGNDSVLDLRARALVLLSFIEADKGGERSSSELRRAAELILGKMHDSSRARLAVAVATCERALRQGRADDAVEVMDQVLRNPRLDDSQRGAAQAVLAGALRLAGREAEGIATLETTADSFARAVRPSAVIDADLERGIHLMQAGDRVAARALLSEVADASATTGNHEAEVEARLRLGLLGAEAREHAESAQQFQLAAAVARRVSDNAKVIVALRNAADELRLQHDLAGAERVLEEVFAIKVTAPLETDIAITKVVLAVLRHDQDRPDEVNRLLNEAAETFQRKLEVLEYGETPGYRERLKGHLREVESLRRTLSN